MQLLVKNVGNENMIMGTRDQNYYCDATLVRIT
jgi:hypothetical protein